MRLTGTPTARPSAMLLAETPARSSVPTPGAVPGSVSVSIRRMLTSVGGRRRGAGAVELAHRGVDAVTGDGEGAGRSASDERLDVGAGIERLEQPVCDRPALAATRPPDADPDAGKLLGPERRAHRAQSFVTREPAAHLGSDVAQLEVDLVVDNQDVGGLEAVEAGARGDRRPGQVHERLRLEQGEPHVLGASGRDPPRELRAPRAVQ